MKPKIVEVLTKILEGLSKNISLEDINRSLLKKKKYDEQSIGIAFSMIYDKIFLKRINLKKQKNKEKISYRFLTEDEKETLGIDNYNYLMHLINVGLLDTDNLEAILEQISIYPENRLTRKEINWIILLSIVDYDSEIPPGSRILLYSSDSVN